MGLRCERCDMLLDLDSEEYRCTSCGDTLCQHCSYDGLCFVCQEDVDEED